MARSDDTKTPVTAQPDDAPSLVLDEEGAAVLTAEPADDWDQAVADWEHELHLGEPRSSVPTEPPTLPPLPSDFLSSSAAPPTVVADLDRLLRLAATEEPEIEIAETDLPLAPRTDQLASQSSTRGSRPSRPARAAVEVEVSRTEISGALPLPPPPPWQTGPTLQPSASSPLDDDELLAALPSLSPPQPAQPEPDTDAGISPPRRSSIASDDEFYDDIQIEHAETRQSQASRNSRPPEDADVADLTPVPDGIGTRLERPVPSDRILGFDDDLTPVPGREDDEETPPPVEVVHTITLEAELPPEPYSARTPPPASPSASSVPPAAVLSQLSHSTLTPPPAPLGGEMLARRLPLPDISVLPPPPRLSARRPSALDPTVHRAVLALLDSEHIAAATSGEAIDPREEALLLSTAAQKAEAIGESIDAQDRYRQALELDPRCRPALRGLRRVLSHPGPAAQPDEAAALLSRELELAGPAEREGLLVQHGELLLQIGQARLARGAYQAALAAAADAGTRLRLLPLLGLCDAALRQGTEGEEQLTAALDEILGLPEVARHRGLWSALQILRARQEEGAGRDAAAAERFATVLRAAEAAEAEASRVHLPAGLGLLRTGLRLADHATLRGAVQTLQGGIAPGTVRQALRRWGAMHTGLPPAEQQAALVAAGDEPRVDRLALADLAEAHAAAGDLVGAAAEWARLAEHARDPGARAALRARAGVAAEGGGALPQARDALEQALRDGAEAGLPRDAFAARALSRVLHAAGDPAGLLMLVRLQLEADAQAGAAERPGGHEHALSLRLKAARLLLQEERGADAALVELRAALALQPDYAPAVALARDLLVQAGRRAEAAPLLLAAAAAQGDDGQTRALVYREEAARLLIREEPAEAARLLKEELARHPTGLLAEQLRWQLQRVLSAGGRTELVPETDPARAAELVAALRAEAEETKDAQRAADLWLRCGLLLGPTDPVLSATAGPVEAALARALSSEPAHGPALLALTIRAMGTEPAPAPPQGALVQQVLAHHRERLVSAAGRPEALLLLLRLGALQEHQAQDTRAALQTLTLVRALPFPGAADLVKEELGRLTRKAADPASTRELLLSELSRTQDQELRFALLMRLGESLDATAEHSNAASYYAQALDLRPGHQVTQAALRRSLSAAHAYGRLRELFQAELAEATDYVARAAAQERLAELATQDPAQRADPERAVHEYRELLTIEANHHVATRFLERHYIATAQWGELIHLYEQLGLVATDPAFAVHVHLDRARLRQRLYWQREREAATSGEPLDEILNELENDFRLALYRDRHSRPALRYVLAAALRTHDLQQVADLSTRLAEICDQSGTGRGEAGDGRAAAVFLTRAAECYAALQHSAETISLAYRAALERNPLHLPALRGALQHALSHARWAEAAEAAEGCGAALHDPAERYAMFLLAGTIAHEQLGDTARALQDYREALRSDPTRTDAFERMRVILLGHSGNAPEPQALADLLREQLLIEGDPQRQIGLRLELAVLLRDTLGNRPQAKAELRQALTLDQYHPAVLEMLSGLHYEDADWDKAAELLLRRARVERRTEELAEIFVRLGQIYGEHTPDARRAVAAYLRALELMPEHQGALSQLSALYLANERPELAIPLLTQLTELVPDREQRVAYLHRIGRLHEGLSDVRAAREAFLKALELDPMYLPAVGALAHFFDRQSDVQSMRVHLDRSALRWRQALRDRPEDVQIYHALFQIAGWRRATDQALTIAGVMQTLGGGRGLPPDAAALLAREPRGAESYPGAQMRDNAVDEMLFPASIPPGFRYLFSLLGDVLLKAYRVDWKRLEAMGLSKRDKLPKSGHPLRDLANRLAADLGAGEFDIYVTAAQGKDEAGRPVPLCLIEATEPVSLILSNELVAGATEGELRFLLGRLLKLVAAQMVLPLRLAQEDLSALVGGLVRLYVKDYVPIGIAERRVVAEAVRLQRLLPRKLEAQLLPFAMECSSAGLDLVELPRRLHLVGNHAGLLLSGSVIPALHALGRLGPSAQSETYELMHFAISDEYAELRRMVGMSL